MEAALKDRATISVADPPVADPSINPIETPEEKTTTEAEDTGTLKFL